MIKKLDLEMDQKKFIYKHNEAHLKVYTGFDAHKLFMVLLEYLQLAVSSLNYLGSNTNIKKNDNM